MEETNSTFPNVTYLDGLRNADSDAVNGIYQEFRQQIVKAVEKAGGTFADGGAFFRVALMQTAKIAKSERYPADVPVADYLEALAVAQYRDWLREKGQSPEVKEHPELENAQLEIPLPDSAELADMRRISRAKRQFTRLISTDQKNVLSLAQQLSMVAGEGVNGESETWKGSVERYKQLLSEYRNEWADPLPSWAVWALTDEHFHKVWSACEAAERSLEASQIPDNQENKRIRNAFIVFVLLTVGYAAYTWIFRDRSPAEVYQSNFEPPASIVEDIEKRYARDTVPALRPEACSIAFQDADAHYKKKEWGETANVLVEMMEDSLASCQSDALFYLAIVGLEMDRPELTLECISKIEDLERFGEDIYWYMALAYVKIAAQDPSEKETARRAVERALSNTEIPERRKQAEKMLEDLAE